MNKPFLIYFPNTVGVIETDKLLPKMTQYMLLLSSCLGSI